MSRNKSRLLAGMFLCAPLVAGIQTASAEPVPGGSLNPLDIPKYVTPLVIPPVLFDDGGAPGAPQGPPSSDGSFDIEISLRQINQQVLPAGFPATPLWAYGNPAADTDTGNPTYNNPGFTMEVTQGNRTSVKWSNELVADPAVCRTLNRREKRRAPECKYLQHIIQDQAGVPVVDQTLHWAAPNRDCRDGIPRPDCRGASAEPYLGPVPMVTHVHGAAVGPGSDGYPEAWWLPAANDIPDSYARSGTFYRSPGGRVRAGGAIFRYDNEQPTTTLWYHDHTLGMTRLNVYAASAGFWLIRSDAAGDGDDNGESGLLTGTLPGPAPRFGDDPNGDPAVRNAIREIPIAIQPKSFNADGTLFYTADRAFFEGLGDGGTFALNTGMTDETGVPGTFPFLPSANSDIAPVWNPEAFFNTMTVNGNTWPQLEVAQEQYRLRFVNASDSRFLNMALRVVNADGTLGEELPFYMIGSDQSLLPAVVRIETGFATTLPGNGSDVGSGVLAVPSVEPDQALLMGPAERVDAIVDFSGLLPGTFVRMTNTAPDAPFGGFGDPAADPGTTGQVMQFVVNMALNTTGGDPSTPAASLMLDPNPGGDMKLPDPGPANTRDLALLEEESAKLCVFVNAVTGAVTIDPNNVPPVCNGLNPDTDPLASFPFAPKEAVLGVAGETGGVAQLWDDPILQNPALDAIENWELWNWSADAHPIHLHLVKFEVVDRQPIGGVARAPEPWEAGWKDTVIAYPDEVTRVRAQFDKAGLYVWHCHILSHEDNEMMVPFCVGEKGQDCPAKLFTPAP